MPKPKIALLRIEFPVKLWYNPSDKAKRQNTNLTLNATLALKNVFIIIVLDLMNIPVFHQIHISSQF